MKQIICLAKEDIVTHSVGRHFQIDCGIYGINFTPEALDEFIKDASEFIKTN